LEQEGIDGIEENNNCLLQQMQETYRSKWNLPNSFFTSLKLSLSLDESLTLPCCPFPSSQSFISHFQGIFLILQMAGEGS